MAFALTYKAAEVTEFVGLPAAHFELADQTGTVTTATAVQDCTVPCRNFRAVVYQKSYTAGGASAGPQYELQVADNSGFTTNLRTLGSVILDAVLTSEQTGVIVGQTPLLAGQQFTRIRPVMSSTSTSVYDVMIDAA